MRRIALVLAFAFLLFGISGCEAGITYDASTNTITLVGDEEKGGSASNPFTFTDVYYADKNGTLTLFSDYVTSGNTYTLTTQVRPTDEGALKVNFSISSLSGSGNITVRGKDKDGEYQEEVIEITNTGNYTTENWYSEITNFTVSGFSADLEVVQGQWGVVWRNENFFRFDAILKIGNDVTLTYFKDVRKIIYFSPLLYKKSAGNILMYIRTKTTVTFGNLGKEESKSTYSGCIFLSPESGSGWGELIAKGNTSFYSCYFGGFKEIYIHLYENSKMWNCHIEQSLSMVDSAEIYHIYSYGQFGGIRTFSPMPHTLVISKDGFKEYRVTFKANKKLDWKIALKQEESDVIVETKERRRGSMEEGLVLGFGFAIVFFGLAIFFLKGGEIK